MEVSYRNSAGRVPIPEVFQHEGTTFVCLNFSSRDLPEGLLSYERSQRYPRAFGSTGVLQTFEWTKQPLWYSLNHVWEGWIPKDAADSMDSFVDLNRSINPCKVEGKEVFIVPPTWARRARSHVLEIQRCCLAIREVSHYGKRSPIPYFIDFKILSTEYVTELEVEIVGAATKRCVLDGRGFLAWWMSSAHNWTEGLGNEIVELMAEMDLLNRTRRGVVVKLPADWQTINIGNLVAHDVPVFYPWTAEEAADPRFTRFNPGFLQSYQEFLASTCDLQETSAESIPGLLAMYPAVLKYDDFGQSFEQNWDARLSDPFQPGRVYHPFVMDFENWKPREIVSKDEAELCEKRYHFRLFNGPPERRKLYWRFRGKDRDERDDISIIFEDDEITLSNIREMYRYRYAPLPGQIFDIETGREIQKPSFTVAPSRRRPRDNGQEGITNQPVNSDDMVVDDQGSSESAPSTSNESLGRPYERRTWTRNKKSQRHKPYSADHAPSAKNVMSKTAEFRRFEANVGSDTMVSRWVTGMTDAAFPPRPSLAERLGDRAPSPSSSRDSEERIAAHADEEARSTTREGILQRLTAWTAKFIVPGPASEVSAVPASCRWNNLLLEKGVLVVPQMHVGVMMRLLANTTPGCTSVQHALTLAIEHGLEFQIYVKQVDVPLFRPSILTPLDFCASVYYTVGFQNPVLPYGNGGVELYNRYKARAMDVLRRPHARAFIGLGGPLSWIARKYGGQDLVRQFMNGPSIQVTVHQRGKVDLTDFSFAQTDEVSPEEIDALLGHVKYGSRDLDKWFYPTPEVLENHLLHYHGDWNPGTEAVVFEAVHTLLEDGRGDPKTISGWHDFLRFANRGRNAPKILPTAKEFLAANADLLSTFGRGWKHLELKDLVIPEVAVPAAVPGK